MHISRIVGFHFENDLVDKTNTEIVLTFLHRSNNYQFTFQPVSLNIL